MDRMYGSLCIQLSQSSLFDAVVRLQPARPMCMNHKIFYQFGWLMPAFLPSDWATRFPRSLHARALDIGFQLSGSLDVNLVLHTTMWCLTLFVGAAQQCDVFFSLLILWRFVQKGIHIVRHGTWWIAVSYVTSKSCPINRFEPAVQLTQANMMYV